MYWGVKIFTHGVFVSACTLCGGRGGKLGLTDAGSRTCGDMSTAWPFQTRGTCVFFIPLPPRLLLPAALVLPFVYFALQSLRRGLWWIFLWINNSLGTVSALFSDFCSICARSPTDWYCSQRISAQSQLQLWSLTYIVHVSFAFNFNLLSTAWLLIHAKVAVTSCSGCLLMMCTHTSTVKQLIKPLLAKWCREQHLDNGSQCLYRDIWIEHNHLLLCRK